MSQLLLDALNNATSWSARQADGVTPSTELTVAVAADRFRFGADQQSLQLTGSIDAGEHLVFTVLDTVALTDFDELRLWLYSNRLADGSDHRPFYLEVRLGSATLGTDAPANPWRRLLPVTRANTWELLRFSLDDLPAAVRNGVTRLQLRCIDATAPFTCWLDDLLAVREEMISDVDEALRLRLHEHIEFAGAGVPAVLHHPEAATQPALPYIRITNYSIQPARERASYPQVRSDYNGAGYRLRTIETGCDLYYAIDVLAADRQAKTRIQEFILQQLAPAGELIVNGMPLPIEWIYENSADRYLIAGAERALLYFKVATRQLAPVAAQVTPPYSEISVAVGQQNQAGSV